MEQNRRRALNSCRSQRKKNKWALDYDYLDKLDDDQVEYLAEFSNFYYHGSPHRCSKYIAMDPVLKRESYTRNNHAGYDVYNRINIVELKSIEVCCSVMIEDIIIEMIDKKNKIEHK